MPLFSSSEYTPPPTPYGGLVDGVPAQTAPHLLVSGPSGTGKSRRVLGPGIVLWDGPVVAVSSKPDLVDLCLESRLSRRDARVYLLDLSGEVPDESLPEQVQRVIVDPALLIESDDDALDLATVLMQSGSVGAGGGSTSGGGDPFWENVSTAPLAALLRAAGTRGMSWVKQAVGCVAPPEKDGSEDEDDDDRSLPCWVNAVGDLAEMGSDALASELSNAAGFEEKMRDSVTITMKSALAPWLRSTVLGRGSEVPFSPRMLEHRNATLFIVAPATGVAAGAAVSVVDIISKRWRANQTEKVKLPRLLMVVDELTNTMPWPKLPTVVTESRAMGIHLLVAVQATSQFARRYGDTGMTELREVFPATLILVGAAEKQMLEHAAWWHGTSERQKVSTDRTHRQSTSVTTEETIKATDLLPKSMAEGRLLRGRKAGVVSERIDEAGVMVDLVDISVLLKAIR